jgi:hypothetical protein
LNSFFYILICDVSYHFLLAHFFAGVVLYHAECLDTTCAKAPSLTAEDRRASPAAFLDSYRAPS